MSANIKRPQEALICVADDDSLLRGSATRLLRSFKFKVKTLAPAEQFFSSEYLGHTACLIVDGRLPGMSGLELQRQLVSQNRRIPIIFITAHADATRRLRGLEAGAVAFLYKPFYERDLLNAINFAPQNS